MIDIYDLGEDRSQCPECGKAEKVYLLDLFGGLCEECNMQILDGYDEFGDQNKLGYWN
jgi:hypothetical protein